MCKRQHAHKKSAIFLAENWGECLEAFWKFIHFGRRWLASETLTQPDLKSFKTLFVKGFFCRFLILVCIWGNLVSAIPKHIRGAHMTSHGKYHFPNPTQEILSFQRILPFLSVSRHFPYWGTQKDLGKREGEGQFSMTIKIIKLKFWLHYSYIMFVLFYFHFDTWKFYIVIWAKIALPQNSVNLRHKSACDKIA